MPFPLSDATPEALKLHPPALARLERMIEKHVSDGRYPGAQIAMARDGRLAFHKSFGSASLEPARAAPPEAALERLGQFRRQLQHVGHRPTDHRLGG